MKVRKRAAAAVVAVAALSTMTGPAGAATATGPSTTTAPYMLPVAAGVDITSLLTVGDAGAAGNGYEMVGIPDGLGATQKGHELTIFMNHELRDSQGITRAHGQRGAFVSNLTLDTETSAVTSGKDQVTSVRYWDYPSGTYVNSAAAPKFADGAAQDLTFGRWCSGTLSDPGMFHAGALGYKGQIYFGNEEDTDNGRVFGVTEDGVATQLPRLGLFSWENTKPAPNKTATTLVMGQEDGPGDASEPWVYVGTKTDSGTPVEQAGLTNGDNHVLDAVNQAVTNDATWRSTFGKGVPARVALVDNDWNRTGAAQNVDSKAGGLALNRIEDGHWDPRNPNDFYFLTTEGGDTTTTFPYTRDGGGLWRLRWDDIENPDLGAELTLLLDGSETIPGVDEPKMNKPDNMAVDHAGNIIIQEDPGNNDHIARIVAYRIADGALGVVSRFDPARFGSGATAAPLPKLTTDEESSGIIDIGDGEYLFDAQVHTSKGLPAGTGPNTVEEYVENGQLMLMKVADFTTVYGS
jgi:hypothetical protein